MRHIEFAVDEELYGELETIGFVMGWSQYDVIKMALQAYVARTKHSEDYKKRLREVVGELTNDDNDD